MRRRGPALCLYSGSLAFGLWSWWGKLTAANERLKTNDQRLETSAARESHMATITADQVKQLRDKTGAGMMECKAALAEANGNLEEATTLLRKRGLAQAAKRAGRATAQGLIGSYKIGRASV